jgi:hypothetical protein
MQPRLATCYLLFFGKKIENKNYRQHVIYLLDYSHRNGDLKINCVMVF